MLSTNSFIIFNKNKKLVDYNRNNQFIYFLKSRSFLENVQIKILLFCVKETIIMKTKKKKKLKKKTKKKIIKKKINKKKIIKKKRKGKKIVMEDIYKLLNKAQMTKKNQQFSVCINDAGTIENIVKDANLEYHRINLKTKVNFVVFSDKDNLNVQNDGFLDIENIDILNEIDPLFDEELEDGQIFH